MNISPVLHNILSGADMQSELPVADLTARAAQMYRSQYGSELSTDSRSLYAGASDNSPKERPSGPPPYAEEFFRGLQNIKPERVETENEDGSIKVTYNYYTSFYDYIRNFSGKGDGVPTCPQIKDQIDMIRWCTEKLTPAPKPSTQVQAKNASESSEYDLQFGLNQTLTVLMSMDYSITEWMNKIFTTVEESEDEETW